MAIEWSRDGTIKLIEMMQANPNLWNSSLCDTRRDKHKRREELRNIAEYLEISVLDVTKKIQHLRTQYNREWVRETRVNAENRNDEYVSSWYAYEYLHFLKDGRKPYRIVQSDVTDTTYNNHSESKVSINQTPPYKISRTDSMNTIKPEDNKTRDDFAVFGEFIANELRSLTGEKNQLIAKKKILDIIFDVKMGNCERQELVSVYTTSPPHITNNIHSDKVFAAPLTTQIEPLPAAHSTPTSRMNEIINDACSYSNFKVDAQ